MINFDLLTLRLRQYGAAWLLAYLAVSIACGVWSGLLHAPLIEAVDVTLLIAFAVLGLLVLMALVLTLASRESGATKTAVVAVGLFLLAPLLWAPVLGAITAAFVAHASIEYSTVYAGFRVLLAKGVYGVMRIFTQNPVIDLGMKLMEIFAAIVGFVASISQVWEVMGRRRRSQAG